MNTQITQLASLAASTLVAAMVGENWDDVEAEFTLLFGRRGSAAALRVAGEMEWTRNELLAAPEDSEPAATMAYLYWLERIRVQFSARRQSAQRAQALLERLGATAPS